MLIWSRITKSHWERVSARREINEKVESKRCFLQCCLLINPVWIRLCWLKCAPHNTRLLHNFFQCVMAWIPSAGAIFSQNRCCRHGRRVPAKKIGALHVFCNDSLSLLLICTQVRSLDFSSFSEYILRQEEPFSSFEAWWECHGLVSEAQPTFAWSNRGSIPRTFRHVL